MNPIPLEVSGPESLINYLVSIRRLERSDINCRRFTILEGLARNHLFKLSLPDRNTGYFIKIGNRGDQRSSYTLRTESGVYDFFGKRPGGVAPSKFLPRKFLFDPKRRLLLLELLETQPKAWTEYLSKTPPGVTDRLADAIGVGMATLHIPRALALRRMNKDLALSSAKPWILTASDPTSYSISQLSRAHFRIIDIIRSRGFRRQLAAFSESWSNQHLIHSDVKTGNILIVPADKGQVLVKFIDWEMAQFGDPVWDIGGILQGILCLWLDSIPFGEGLSLDATVALGSIPIQRIHIFSRAFFAGYFNARRLDASEQPRFISRCVTSCAVRLVQSAFEASHYRQQLPLRAAAMLQLSRNILANLEEAGVTLFGMGEG